MIRKAPMLRRIPKLLRFSLIAAVVLAVSASVYQTWISGGAGLTSTQTAFGPLTQQDINLLTAVRQANLWEGPTSEQAQQMATSAAVRDVGGKLAAEHAELDVETRRIAEQLGVQLPANASSKQQAWMNQIAAATGADYDQTFVQLVRAAHGGVLPVINDVRVSTRNDLIRQFAETADAFVTRHCQYLESTGLVDYSQLPITQASLTNVLTNGSGPQALIVPILVFVAVMIGVVAMLSALRKKKAQATERVTVTKSRPPAASTVSAAPVPARTTVAALPAGGSSAPSAAETSMPGAAYPVGVGAVSGATVIPSARGGAGEPSVQWNLGGPGLRDTGPHPTIDAPQYAPVSDSGAFRINSGLTPDMTGPLGPPIRDDYPGQGYGSGYYPPDNGYGGGPGSGHFPPAQGGGRYRTVSETGSGRPGDSGSHRVPDGATATHRAVNSTGPRHSVRR
jgi:predicted outer membrane protein